jgi:hypothetical protein
MIQRKGWDFHSGLPVVVANHFDAFAREQGQAVMNP